MKIEAVLTGLGYDPNEALLEQCKRIVENTKGFEKIGKHIIDLHSHLKVDDSYVALSNTNDFFKIKIEAPSKERKEEAYEKVEHFASKYKVSLQKVDNKDTFYIIGFDK